MGWFHRPEFWPTTDGVVPYHEFLLARKALHRSRALESLTMARAIALALIPDDKGGDALRRDARHEADPNGA
jgi:hypothetical protein